MDIQAKRAHDRFNEQNNEVIRDYLLPEIRALEDRNDIRSIKQAMQLTKVSESGVTKNNDLLYGILKDIYYK